MPIPYVDYINYNNIFSNLNYYSPRGVTTEMPRMSATSDNGLSKETLDNFASVLEEKNESLVFISDNIYNGCELVSTRVQRGDFVALSPTCHRANFKSNTVAVCDGTGHNVVRIQYIDHKNELKSQLLEFKDVVAIKPTRTWLRRYVESINVLIELGNNDKAEFLFNEATLHYFTDEFRDMVNVPVCSKCGRKTFEMANFEGERLCTECYNRLFARCTRCGARFRRTSDIEDTNDGRNLCPNCAKREYVLPYHRMYPKIKFFGNNRVNSVPYLGIELEVDEGGENDSNVKKLMRVLNPEGKIFAYCSHDSSISDGFEIITQPATLEYHLSIKGIYSSAFNLLRQDGYLSHDTSTCGLHVHFNRDFYQDNEELYISRLLYLVDKFWDDIVKFSRRNQHRIDRFSQKVDSNEIERYISRSNRSESHDYHYYAVNLANPNTIEFRMFKGTLNASTFFSTLQFVNQCIITAKEKNAEEIQRMKFDDLIVGRMSKRYWKRRCDISGTEE